LAEGADQHDPERPVRVVEGEALGGEAAARVPDDERRVEPDGVHERGHVGGVVLGPVARPRSAEMSSTRTGLPA
jgi:hypothetical protein